MTSKGGCHLNRGRRVRPHFYKGGEHLRRIYQLHRVTSFLAAPFLVIFCLTGLALLFSEEIYDWNTEGHGQPQAEVEKEALYGALGEAVSSVQASGASIRSVRFAPEEGRIRFRLRDQAVATGQRGRFVDFYLQDGELENAAADVHYRCEWLNDVMVFLRRLHVRLSDGEAGRVLMAVACALSMVSIGTGFLLYPRFMKGLSFGARRQFSRRLWWSDWHKALGILAGGWLFVLSFTGVALYLYRQAADQYQAGAYREAAEVIAPAAGAPLDLPAALARVRLARPEDRVLAIFPPDKKNPFFTFEIAETSTIPRIHTVRQWLFLSADGTGDFFAPPPVGIGLGSLAVNLHLRNHGTLALKALWSFFLLLSLLLTVSGLAIYLTRFPKSAGAKALVTPLVSFGTGGVWVLALLPVAGLFLPLWGATEAATAAFLLVAVGTVCLVDKAWCVKK